MLFKSYVNEDDWFNRFVKPWILAIAFALLGAFALKQTVNYFGNLISEHNYNKWVSESIQKAPEENDYREGIPDESIGDYYYNEGNEIIDYPGEIYLVKDFIDARTIIVSFRGKDTAIRLLGVTIPECYKNKSLEYIKSFLSGRRVKIDFDDTYGYYAPDGTITAYVTLDTFSVNGSLILNGYALADRNSDYMQKGGLIDSELFAEYEGIGLWSECEITSKEGSYI